MQPSAYMSHLYNLDIVGPSSDNDTALSSDNNDEFSSVLLLPDFQPVSVPPWHIIEYHSAASNVPRKKAAWVHKDGDLSLRRRIGAT